MADFDNPFDTYTAEDDLLVKELLKPKYRTKKVQLVLFGGKAGVGKTTAANFVLNELQSFSGLVVEKRGFAAPVKEIASSCFKWDGVKDDKGRRLLQVIGTDAGREYNPNIWVEYMDEYILGNLFIPNIILVDDWRFPNEKEYFLDNILYDVTAIKILRNSHTINEEASKHPSENSLPENNDYYNFIIDNNETLNDLYNKLGGIINHLKNKVITY